MASLSYYISNGLVLPMYEVQRLPGCSQAPGSCLVRVLLREAGLWPVGVKGFVLDLTFGRGKFYEAWPFRPRVIAYDIRRLNWVVEPTRFVKAPAWAAFHHVRDGSLRDPVELVVVDPPWQDCRRGNGCIRRVGDRWFYRTSRMVGTPEMILESAARVSRLLGVPMLIHFSDRWVPEGFKVLVEVFWKPSLPRASKEYRSWWGLVRPVGVDGSG